MGVKENLALTLVNHHGGHVCDTYLALSELKNMKEDVDTICPFLGNSVRECLNRTAEYPSMINLLSEPCLKGFVPISGDEQSSIAEVLSKYGVASVVVLKTATFGIHRKDFGRSVYGIMPSIQSMRLLIAHNLVETTLVCAYMNYYLLHDF